MKTKNMILSARLVGRFCVIGLPVYLCLCFLLILAYEDYRRAGLEDEIATEVAAISASLSKSLRPFILRGDDRGATDILRVASGTRALICLEVRTASGVALARWPGLECRKLQAASSYDVPIWSDDVSLGQLSSHYSTAWAQEKLRKESVFIYGATAIGSLGALVAFVFAYHFAVGSRIDRLRRAIDDRAQSGEDQPVDIGSGDPLGDVAKAYNAMLIAARRQAAAIKWAEEEATQMTRRAAAARAENEARTRFLETASHELRTPLNGILGAAEILSGANLTAKQRRCSIILREASQKLEATIALILEEAGRASRP